MIEEETMQDTEGRMWDKMKKKKKKKGKRENGINKKKTIKNGEMR
jgi:hypothetical protein